jgi:hypothetical protein
MFDWGQAPWFTYLGAKPNKLFMAVIYGILARVLVPGKPFQPSPMFAGKARQGPTIEWSN